jgi:hypothetical protein
MVNGVSTSRRDRTAIAGSIALHLCVLAALMAIPRPTLHLDDPDERVLLTSLTRIEHRPPARVAVRRPHRIAAPEVRPNAPMPIAHVAVSRAHAARKLVVATERRYSPLPQRAAPAIKAPPAQVEALPERHQVAVVASEPTATATPTAAPAETTNGAAQHEDGIGNFGETYPATVDPAARGALFVGLGGGIDVRITVDENGRATSVEFVRAPADASLRDELRTRLLAARFVPAACNGLRCIGTVELRN